MIWHTIFQTLFKMGNHILRIKRISSTMQLQVFEWFQHETIVIFEIEVSKFSFIKCVRNGVIFSSCLIIQVCLVPEIYIKVVMKLIPIPYRSILFTMLDIPQSVPTHLTHSLYASPSVEESCMLVPQYSDLKPRVHP